MGIAATLVVGVAAASPQGREDATAVDFDRSSALRISQAAIGRTVGDYRLLDRRGEPMPLAQFRGRPLVISLIYTSCYHTCPMLTAHLARVTEVAREAVGKDNFSVLTIGFDAPTDTPARMRVFARERGIDAPDWRFASADAETIANLTRELGFVFYRSPKGFDHIAQTTVLDARGRVYRQVYGASFEPPALVEPLKQLVFGTRANANTLSGWVNGVRLFCTVYDPTSGRYRFDYSLFVGIGVGLLTLGATAVFVLRAWRQSKPPTSAG